jgi:xanthine dehydrogenase accessory factor
MKRLVMIKGAGDMATGIAHRLFRSGFTIVMTELPQPTAIRRTVAFAEAVFSRSSTVEGVTAVRVEAKDAGRAVAEGRVAVIVDPAGSALAQLNPWAMVDAVLAKKNTGTTIDDAPVVIGVGPGFTAGVDVHAVIETMRGHYLGRVIDEGTAAANTGIPGAIGGYTLERIIRAPGKGVFAAVRAIGDTVTAGEIVGYVDSLPVRVVISGVLRGFLHEQLPVEQGMKIGDVDPRCERRHCFSISDKARAVGGGVLEALLNRAFR